MRHGISELYGFCAFVAGGEKKNAYTKTSGSAISRCQPEVSFADIRG